jgi:ribosomal protein S18 acetylase RimI-like enzyme
MHEYAYPEHKILAELSDKENLHYIVRNENEPVGYLKLRLQATLEGLPALEIERIYLHRKAAGKGMGKQLMLFSEEIALQHNKQLLFLKAMDSSVDALAFYHKLGYTDHGRLTLPFPLMKEEFRGMIILRKDLR